MTQIIASAITLLGVIISTAVQSRRQTRDIKQHVNQALEPKQPEGGEHS